MSFSTEIGSRLITLCLIGLLGMSAMQKADGQIVVLPNGRIELPRRSYPANETNYYTFFFTVEAIKPKSDHYLKATATFLVKELVGPTDKDGRQQIVCTILSAKFKSVGDIVKDDDVTSTMPAIVSYREPGGKMRTKTEGGMPETISNFTFGARDIGPAEFSYYPQHPVKIGEKWAAIDEGETVGRVKLEAIETLNGLATYRLHTTITSKPTPQYPHKKQIEFMDWIDKSNGRVVQSRMTADLSIEGSRAQVSLNENLTDKLEADYIIKK